MGFKKFLKYAAGGGFLVKIQTVRTPSASSKKTRKKENNYTFADSLLHLKMIVHFGFPFGLYQSLHTPTETSSVQSGQIGKA